MQKDMSKMVELRNNLLREEDLGNSKKKSLLPKEGFIGKKVAMLKNILIFNSLRRYTDENC